LKEIFSRKGAKAQRKPLGTRSALRLCAKKSDPMYRIENAITVEDRSVNGKAFQTGVFDIVLER
jgi:hypothetical protein